MNWKLSLLLEMFVFYNVMCGSDKNKPWVAARIARRKWFPHNTRYFMWRGMTIVCDFIDSRLRNVVSGFEFFGHCDLLVVDERANEAVEKLTS